MAAGAAADNYSFSYVAGDYTIVPAGSLVVTASGASVYGQAVTYSVLGAKYMNGNSALFTLAAPTQVGNTFTFDDGVGGETILTLTPDSPVLSGSSNLVAGRYDLAATAVTSNSNNYGAAITVVGSHEVSQRDLTVTASGLSKVYDGTTDMVNLALSSNAIAGDRISLSASSAYADKNVHATKSYVVNNIATSGLDAGNYNLLTQSITGTNGAITQRMLNVSYFGVSKVYDGLATATVSTSDDRVAGDQFTISRTATFQSVGAPSKTVGANKDVAVTAVSISGSDANNYALASTTGT
ncbi:MAG: hypothetical protein EBT14_08910, partial [Betaproteobacteria bacterium]|nr:hypothetical protein [Betaproteobacteria bacterium]